MPSFLGLYIQSVAISDYAIQTNYLQILQFMPAKRVTFIAGRVIFTKQSGGEGMIFKT